MQRICLNGLKSGQIACKPQAVNMAVYRPQLWRAFACVIAILIGLSGTALAQSPTWQETATGWSGNSVSVSTSAKRFGRNEPVIPGCCFDET